VWGIRAQSNPSNTPLQQLLARCQMFALRMPPGAFASHSTAALLYGAPLPFELEYSGVVHMSVAAPARAPHAAGIRGHQLAITSDQLQSSGGITLTTPARTWCDLASVLKLHDLVAAGDFLIQRSSPHTSLVALRRMSECFAGQRGMATIRRALPLLNDRGESRPESVLRVVLQLGGLPQPRINRDIVFVEDGTLVRTDFSFDEYRVLLEYQGDYHRTTKGQWRKDMTRRSRLEAEGWFVIEINADDLKHPDELVARIRSVLRQRGYRG
jgi:very-short-patch-repair endonuclease